MNVVWLIIIVLIILWALGFFGRGYRRRGLIHILLVIAVILIILALLGII